jgi:hypothetical protein
MIWRTGYCALLGVGAHGTMLASPQSIAKEARSPSTADLYNAGTEIGLLRDVRCRPARLPLKSNRAVLFGVSWANLVVNGIRWNFNPI